MTTQIAGELVMLDPEDPRQVRAVAQLHDLLLPSSPIRRLGLRFMTHFYYRELVRDELVRVHLYRIEGQSVGFLAFTEHPHTFMAEGRRRHPLRLAFVLGMAILAKPSRVRTLWEAVTISRRADRSSTGGSASVGEVLSFGVLPRFRSGERGSRVSNQLFDATLRFFRERRFSRVEWNVERANERGQHFYRTYGARFEEAEIAGPDELRGTLELQ